MGFKIVQQEKLGAVWVDFDEDNKFLINPEGLKAFDVVTEQHARITALKDQKVLEQGFNPDTLKDASHLKPLHVLQRESMAQNILKGWQGDITENDKPIEYSPESAFKLLTAHGDLFQWVYNEAMRLQLESFVAMAETLGKLKTDSSINSNGAETKPRKPKSQKG